MDLGLSCFFRANGCAVAAGAAQAVNAGLRWSSGGQPGGAGRWSMVSNLVVIGFLVRMVKALCVRVQLLKAGFGRLSNSKKQRSQPSAAPTFGMHFPVGAAEGCDLSIFRQQKAHQ
jgi:hypothetical protein